MSAVAKAAKEITLRDLEQFDLAEIDAEIAELEATLAKRKAFARAVRMIQRGPIRRKPRSPKAKAAPPTTTDEPRPAPAAAPPAAAPPAGPKTAASPPANGRPKKGPATYVADRIFGVLNGREKMSLAQIAKAIGAAPDSVRYAISTDDRFDVDAAGLWCVL